jgi:hypothetical protein
MDEIYSSFGRDSCPLTLDLGWRVSYPFKTLKIFYIHEEGKNKNIPVEYSEVFSYYSTGKVIMQGFIFYVGAENAPNSVDLGHTIDNENYINT